MKGTGYFLFRWRRSRCSAMLVRGRDRRTLLGLGVIAVALVAVSIVGATSRRCSAATLVTAPARQHSPRACCRSSDPVGYLTYVWQLFFPPVPGRT